MKHSSGRAVNECSNSVDPFPASVAKVVHQVFSHSIHMGQLNHTDLAQLNVCLVVS